MVLILCIDFSIELPFVLCLLADDVDDTKYGYGFTYVRSGVLAGRGRMNNSDAGVISSSQWQASFKIYLSCLMASALWQIFGEPNSIGSKGNSDGSLNPINKPLRNSSRRILKGAGGSWYNSHEKVAGCCFTALTLEPLN